MDIGKSIGLEYGAATRDAFGEALEKLGHENQNIVVVDGDVSDSTRTQAFRETFPERFFNVGIAESNLVGVASGLAASGKQALASSFAVFLLCNAYDQIRMSIAYPHLDVKLVGSHSGISLGEDGASQMAIEDLALAASLPNFTVLVPADEQAAAWATRAMFEHEGPVYLRTGRPDAPKVYSSDTRFEIGKAVRVRDGDDVTIIACGLMVAAALEAAQHLSNKGIEARVLDMHAVKPLDQIAVIKAANETGAIVTAEEHTITGGLGAAVAQVVVKEHPVPVGFVAIMDTYAESGDPNDLFKKYGLSPEHIIHEVESVIDKKA
ncbi:transketolase family protein [Phototrophicus methaneseepsis]|uniref:Transketolase family protein n=1 Tax=Phototrophicus methaneseepsis TaxID=2710758 RepID=A0A7S8ECZ1_9CHLR|nr:transketolase C-terminal domain-containing protein [Phototrophicus methaneseepsis]QPC84695.1 transketolase family protein [Phototrophicus methaneseepsis]